MVPPHVANCRDPGMMAMSATGCDKRPSRKVARHADAASGLRGFHKRTVLSSPPVSRWLPEAFSLRHRTAPV